MHFCIITAFTKTYKRSVFVKELYRGLSQWLGGKPSQHSLPALGGREIDVLKVLWQHGELSAQEVLTFFANEQLSLSTMQSTLERLFRKNMLTRYKQGRSYRYAPALSQSTVVSRLMGEIADQLGNGESQVIVSGFMSYIEGQTSKEEAEKLSSYLPSHEEKDD
ncbi:MAG TPA: hypothetical protein DCL26_10140 [Alteromonas australica]|uniref:BlaI/MecI/CopY family transcriptional regulator n=1 Tax=Alteromonas australica TaxID=589873 RepID=A0A353JHS9_9ALTE|nr:hypothetical protein [Alteromonas sp.]HAI72677.1 hypothetical protein [Alteromonas australica]HAU27895.1 hypothetical protein [Alteromonas australica]HBF71064.1 hypothetical protein [Alteromonas australica]HBU50944.1 hypothetical protein [Alteromonas australica]